MCCFSDKTYVINGTLTYRLYISNQQSLLKFLRIIAPIIPVKDMMYKVMFVPKNNLDLLQRWASEICELVQPEFQMYLKKEYHKIMDSYTS